MARLQDFQSVTPNTANDNLLIVQSAGQGNAKIDVVGQKIATETTHSGLTTTSKKLVGAINELNSGKVNKSAISSLIALSSKSGAVASFSTDIADKLYSCKANIVAQQASGTPSPSSPKTIVGYNSIALSDTPKNFFSGAVVSSDIDTDGQIIARTSAYWRSDKIPVGSVKKFTFSVFSNPNYATGSFNYRAFDSSGVMVTEANLFTNIGTTPSHTTVTLANNVAYVYIRGYQSGGASGITNSQIQFEFGETQSAYQPFGTTTPVSLGQTIYGGTAELVGGNGSKTFGYADLGELNWGKLSSVTGAFYSIQPTAYAPRYNNDYVANAICEQYKVVSRNNLPNNDCSFSISYSDQVYLTVKDERYSTSEAFKTAMSGVHIVYELATPVPFTFTGANVYSKSGLNNVFADSGDVDLKYLETIGNKFNS